ncbi:MAG: hypothetical protein AAFZ74_11125 [Pseudomonadota bacterium]
MKLKLLSAAATTTIAALISMPGQQAYADECRIENSEGGENDGGAISEDGTALACGDDARARSNSVALGENARAGYGFVSGAGITQLFENDGGGAVGNVVAVGSGAQGFGNRSTAIGGSAIAGRIVTGAGSDFASLSRCTIGQSGTGHGRCQRQPRQRWRRADRITSGGLQ